MSRRSLPLFVAVLALSASQLLAAEKVTLRPAAAAGQAWTFETSQDFSWDNKATANGQTQPFTSKTSQRRTGKIEVLEARGGVPSSIRVTFDTIEASMETAGQRQQAPPSPYAGNAITVTRGPDGKVTDDFRGQVDPAAQAELHALLDEDVIYFPKQPVAIDEEWSPDPQALARVVQLRGPNDRAGMTLKLLSVKDVDGRPTAEVKVSLAVEMEQQGMSSQVIAQGVALVDVKTGHVVKQDMKGNGTMRGEQRAQGFDGQPMSYQVEGKGVLNASRSSKLLAGEDVARAPTSDPPNEADNPIAGGGGDDDNPLGERAESPFAGEFSDGKLTVKLSPTGDGPSYKGTLTLNNRTFSATALAKGNMMEGSFESSGKKFNFSAELQSDTLTLKTGGKTYTLKKAGEPENPLGRGDPGGGGGEPFTTVARTDWGTALSTQKPGVTTARAALQAVLPDIARHLGAKPGITGAYEDTRNPRSGLASFTSRANGRDVKGLIACNADERGASIAVLYCRADAPPQAWNQLVAAASQGTGTREPAARVEAPPLREFRFPDNTGSVGIAEGWRTQSQSAGHMVTITGPQDQTVSIGFSLSVVTPDSTAVQMQRQLEQQAREIGAPPPQPLQLLVAPFTGPGDAIANLTPQISYFSQKQGGPALQVADIQELKPLQGNMQGGRAALVTYRIAKETQAGRKVYRTLASVEVSPLTNDAWMFYAVAVEAPEETYERDLPAMLAMANSLKTNDAVLAQKTRDTINASNREFAARQKAHAEVMASYDAQNQAWRDRQVSIDKRSADFGEALRGYRTIEDTTTGERKEVPLGDAKDIVDTLNEGDPGRYKEIPARDMVTGG